MEIKRIILSGGGTGGSVSPLLAVAEEIKKKNPKTQFLFIGTKKGVPEKELAQMRHFPYQGIFSGKLRRYFSFKNIIDPFFIFLGFIQSFFILLKFKPKAIFSAGSFVAVPLSLAARILRIPVYIHQQDIVPGLANKIITPLAEKITISFKKSLNDFPKDKTIFTGNPVRSSILLGDKKRAIKRFNLKQKLSTLLIMGGGTGAKKINELIFKIIPELAEFCQIIHITGKNKQKELKQENLILNRYHQIDFLTRELPDVYQIADLVVSRAGLGSLTELSALGKPSIIIPIPNSHQEINASYFKEQESIVVLEQKEITSELLLKTIKELIENQKELKRLEKNILKMSNKKASEKIAEIILRG